MTRARLSLVRYRRERRDMVRQYIGNHWSEEGTPEKVPVNLIALYVQIVSRNLIAKNPRVMLSTFDRALKPTVAAMQQWANDEMGRMGIAATLQRVVVDALFSLGICKVALATPADAAVGGWGLAAGQPSADDLYNAEGDERINVLGRGTYASNTEEFEDHVDLWEVYLPRHRQVLTLADDNLAGASPEPLRQVPWLGPATGPYHFLAFGVVPGNAMPKGPIMDLVDLHEAANRTVRKAMRTVDRMKELTVIAGGALEDGARVQQADDGDIIRSDNPERTKQVVYGGQHLQVLLAAALTWKDNFAWHAGNLDMMGGLSPQSKTAAQDKLLAANASGGVADLQDRTLTFTSDVIEALCWYWHNHPGKVMTSTHTLPGLPGVQLQRQVTPAMRQRGRFEDLDVQVDPYSMQHQTPETRMAALNQVVTQIIIPMMQLLVQAGISFDVNAYLQKLSKYMDMPDLADIITIAEPPPVDTQAREPDAAPKPAETTRNYVRENRPSSTREASDRNLVSSLMGVNPGGNPKNGAVP